MKESITGSTEGKEARRARMNMKELRKHLGEEGPSPYPETSNVGYDVEPTFAGVAHRVFVVSSTGARIFLGPRRAAKNTMEVKQSLEESNVTAIVDCTMGADDFHSDQVEYSRVPVRDTLGANIIQYLPGAAAFMHLHLSGRRHRRTEGEEKSREAGSVLVHCEVGMSRSATVVMAYLIQYHGMTRDEAYLTVKKNRPMVQPNHDFWIQLGELEKLVREKDSQTDPPNQLDLMVQMPTENLADRKSFEAYAKQSSAMFATLGSIVETSKPGTQSFEGGDEEVRGQLFGDLSTIGEENVAALLDAALDFLWDRGILTVDLQWLVALSEALERKLNVSISELLMAILDDAESDFCQRRAGEIYPPKYKESAWLFHYLRQE